MGKRVESHENETENNGLVEREKEPWLEMVLAWVRNGRE
jgi:hypothetical protein